MELSNIICLIIGAYLGFKLNDIIMRWTFKKMIEEAGLTTKDIEKLTTHWSQKLDETESEMETVEIKVEQHNGCLYAFRKDNDAFLGQGATKEDLIARMGEKLRNVHLSISQEDGADFIGGRFSFNTDTKKITDNS